VTSEAPAVPFAAPSWLVDWLSAWSVWDFILLTGAVVGVVEFIRRKGWRWLKGFAKAILAIAEVIDNVKELPAFIARTDERLEEHTRQLKNSHDSNLRDDITKALETAERTEQSVEGLHGRLDDVDRQLSALTREDEALWAAIEETQNPEEETP